MNILIGFLSIVLAVDALLLILLVLLQLPKKDAGAGVAFGGGTTDALFGPGAGNILTQITKYTAGIFIGLSLVLSVLIINQNEAQDVAIEKAIEKQQQQGLKPVDVNTPEGTNNQSATEASDQAPISIDQVPAGAEGATSSGSGGSEQSTEQTQSDAAEGTADSSQETEGGNTASESEEESTGPSLEAGSSSEDSSSESTDSPSGG